MVTGAGGGARGRAGRCTSTASVPQRVDVLFSGPAGAAPRLGRPGRRGGLRYRKPLLDAIDRRFFREQFDARQILTLLVERIRSIRDSAAWPTWCRGRSTSRSISRGSPLLALDARSGLLIDPRNRTRAWTPPRAPCAHPLERQRPLWRSTSKSPSRRCTRWRGTSPPSPSSRSSSTGCASSCARRSGRWRRWISTPRSSTARCARCRSRSRSAGCGRRTSTRARRAGLRPGQARAHARDPRHARRYAPSAFGNQAPDSGNSEILALARARPSRRSAGCTPLLAGDLRSAFSMTEPETPASDPTLLTTRAVRDGDEWVIDGHKWFSSNALDRRLPHRHGRHRPRRAPAPARVDVHRPGRHARAWTSSATCPTMEHPPGAVRQARRPRRDPSTRTCACPRDEPARRRGRGLPARPAAARPGPHPPLHALARRRAAGVRHALRARDVPRRARRRCSPRSRPCRTGSPTRRPRCRPRG